MGVARWSLVCAGVLAAASWGASAGESKGDARAVKAGEYGITGPYTHKNLDIFLIHGEEKLKGKRFLTLKEALEQKKVIVHETGDVNKLAVENISVDEFVYIQAGDIVKGGKQDRTLAVDLIVKPMTGKVPIASFCVESGRWHARGAASGGGGSGAALMVSGAAFSSSEDQVATRSMKLAAKMKGSQSEVWTEVKKAQDKLSKNVGEKVNSPVSQTSMQLALENRKLKSTADDYVKALGKAVHGKADAIGFAFAINGEMNAADVYASRNLFVKLWPKMLKAAAVEAIAELDGSRAARPAKRSDVEACIYSAGKGKADDKRVSEKIRMITTKNDKYYRFDTVDEESDDLEIHRNWLAH